MRSTRLLAAPLVLALAAGCGSTVQTRSAAVQGTDAGGAPGTAATRSSLSGTGPVGGPLAGGAAAAGSGAGTAGSATTVGGPSPSVPLEVRGTRRTVSALRVGVIYLKGLEQAYAAVGASSGTADSKSAYDAVFRYLDAHGGAGGVKLLPTYVAVDASSTQSQATQVQAACATFTGDHPVDIVLSYTRGSGGDLAHCLGTHGIPLVNGYSEAATDDGTFAANPLYWEPSQLSLDRLGRLLARDLTAQHYLDARWAMGPSCATVSTPRLGVVTFDRPEYRAAYEHSLAPAFRAAGHPVYDAVFISVSGGTAQQLSDASSGAQSAVLKFSSECVDHVVFVSAVALDYLFMNIADQQGYRPRYGLSSLEAPPVIIANLANAKSQLHGALGPGWSPYSDVDVADFDALAKAPAALCMRILAAAGAAPKDNNSAILALPSCEGPLFTSAVVARWVSSPPSTSMLDVVDALGSSYRPVGTYTSWLGKGRHDGATSYRPFAFVDACGCFRYASGLRPV